LLHYFVTLFFLKKVAILFDKVV